MAHAIKCFYHAVITMSSETDKRAPATFLSLLLSSVIGVLMQTLTSNLRSRDLIRHASHLLEFNSYIVY